MQVKYYKKQLLFKDKFRFFKSRKIRDRCCFGGIRRLKAARGGVSDFYLMKIGLNLRSTSRDKAWLKRSGKSKTIVNILKINKNKKKE